MMVLQSLQHFCVYACGYACHSVSAEFRGPVWRMGSFLPPCHIWSEAVALRLPTPVVAYVQSHLTDPNRYYCCGIVKMLLEN